MKPKRTSYPAGWFTRLIFEHNWPPGFVSQVAIQTWSDVDRREAATRGRETQQSKGITGAILGVSKKADAQIDRAKFNVRLRP